MMEPNNCWHCGHAHEASLFCRFCNSLQRPTPDYYRFLGLEPRLHLDPEDLQQRFYRLSRLLHPDRYHRRTSTERQYSLEATAILNDAYRVLRDPVARAEYALKERGFESGERRSKDVPPELLEEVFELNMALEELRDGDTSVRPQLEQARKKFLALQQESDRRLEELFQRYDAVSDRAVLAEIRSVLDRRRYIRNLVGEVEKELV
ncbi:MAG: Fe-S protein assembly co-chaperone HscB [Acidobacteria bacterium]|nr:Fe-S protein assembly co-chaperone HscB [Acidobacteriota bacterium]